VSQQPSASVRDRFNRAASRLTGALGSPFALVAAVALIVIWATTGPLFNFSETWQLIINTGTKIFTFLMVFVIQASQNRDSKALHLKLDEVIRAVEGARNEFIVAEQSSEDELRQREEEFVAIAANGGSERLPGSADLANEDAVAAARNHHIRTAAGPTGERDALAEAAGPSSSAG
jgi:low affinity Fe/Cu permease